MPGPLTYVEILSSGLHLDFLFLIAGLGVCIFQAHLSATARGDSQW